jgi:hypothetical protein
MSSPGKTGTPNKEGIPKQVWAVIILAWHGNCIFQIIEADEGRVGFKMLGLVPRKDGESPFPRAKSKSVSQYQPLLFVPIKSPRIKNASQNCKKYPVDLNSQRR